MSRLAAGGARDWRDDLLRPRRGLAQRCASRHALRPRSRRHQLRTSPNIRDRSPAPPVALRHWLRAGPRRDAADNGHNVILVTLDGVRVQEFFGGMDAVIAKAPEAESGIYEAEVTSKRWWRETPEARREALMPFFWKTLAPAGMVLGNQAQGQQGHGAQRPVVLLPGLLRDPDRPAAAGRQEQRLRALPAPHRARVRAAKLCRSSDRRSRRSAPGTASSMAASSTRRRVLHERRLRPGARRAQRRPRWISTTACARRSSSSGKRAATTCSPSASRSRT